MATDLTLRSGAFGSGASIPTSYTCEGDNVSPPLTWEHAPDDTASFALVVEDPDAPGRTFVHWVLFNLPGDLDVLPPNLDLDDHLGGADPAPQFGSNDFGDTAYGGPCPPPGDDPHHYHFHLYALDTTLDLGAGVSKRQLMQAIDEHVLGEAELIGTFQR
jgi:hypothetical protein